MIESKDGSNQNKGKGNENSSTPVLDNFSRDLIKLAEEGKLDPVIGREREITRIAQILSRRKRITQSLLANQVVVKQQLPKD